MKKTCGSALIVLLASAGAQGSIFDFEDQAVTAIGGIRTGTHTSLTIENDGLEMTIYRSSGAAFDIFPNDAFGPDPMFLPPATWQSNSWDPFWDVEQFGDTIVLNFSSMVTDFSFRLGDYGTDEDNIYVYGYTGLDGTGDLVDENYEFLEGNDTAAFTEGGLQLSGNIRSVVIEISGDFPSSLFLDNIRATAVPSPSALGILGLGVLGLARRTRR